MRPGDAAAASAASNPLQSRRGDIAAIASGYAAGVLTIRTFSSADKVPASTPSLIASLMVRV